MRKSKLIPTAVIGRQTIYNEGLRTVVGRYNFHVKLRYNTLSSDIIQKISASGVTLCLIVGADWPGVALEVLIGDLRKAGSECCVVVLSEDCSADMIDALLVSGVNGWLPLALEPDGLIHALNLIVSNEVNVAVLKAASLSVHPSAMPIRHYAPQIERLEEAKPVTFAPCTESMRRLASLSEREKSVLERLLKGESNKHIARALLISEATVKIHVRTLLKKIGAENRTQAAVWALQGKTSHGGEALNGTSFKN